KTTKDPGQGTGIGLTVVRTIVERMRGAIEIGAGATAGASFTVHWPRRAATVAEAHTTPADGAVRPGTGQVIMIVDDEPALASLLEELAASLGYEPLGLTDPIRALEVLRRAPTRIDALVTDERMHGMRARERRHVAHGHDDSADAVDHDLRTAAAGRHDGRDAVRHRFDQRAREPLALRRRQREDVAGGRQRR